MLHYLYMMIKELIEQDIKKSMLAGDKEQTTTLRGLKSAIQYAEVAGADKQSLDDSAVTSVLQKEAKKRKESIVLYRQGGNDLKAAAEEREIAIIQKYLPKQLTEEDVKDAVDQMAKKLGITDIKDMGRLIGAVKQQLGASADGAIIAAKVKEYLAI